MPHNIEHEPQLLQEFSSHLSPSILEFLTEADCRRFLRARNWNVKKAVEMTEKWWSWFHTPLHGGKSPATILDDVEDPHESVYLEFMPHANYGEDHLGRPIYWEKTGLISSRFQAIKTKLKEEDLVIRHVRQQELMIRRLEYLSKQRGELIEKQVIIFDLAHLSYSMDTTAMSTFRHTLHIDQHYYPERLQTLVMVNAPWFFTMIWAMVKPWIDPITAEKIHIIGSDYIGHLKGIVDEKFIPVEMGGKCEDFPWQWPFPESTGIHASQLHAYNELKLMKKAEQDSHHLSSAANQASAEPLSNAVSSE